MLRASGEKCLGMFQLHWRQTPGNAPQGQPFINGCFNWMIPNLYMQNGCFTKHLFINGCLGFQVVMHCCNPFMSWSQKHPNRTALNIAPWRSNVMLGGVFPASHQWQHCEPWSCDVKKSPNPKYMQKLGTASESLRVFLKALKADLYKKYPPKV